MIIKDDELEWLDPTSRWEQEVGTVYDLVSVRPRLVFQEVGFVPVELEMAARIQSEIGLIVTGGLHIMDTDSIRHIIKNHGNQKEAMRGQTPLVREDFLFLPNIFGSPNTIESGGKTKQGPDTIKYSRTKNNFCYYYTEELRTKKNRLAAVTFFKRKTRDPTPDAPS